MPVVPQYQPLQPQTGNVTGGLLSARVPQGAFGGAAAEGLAALGRSAAGAAGVAGQVMIQQAEEVNRIKVRQALTEARTETSASVTALMSKTGLNATNVQAEGMERMKTLRSTILEKLDNARQREMFGLIFDDDVSQQVERLGAHQAAQIKAATIQTREAENVSFKNAAVSEHMNPAAVEKNRSFIHSNILETLTSMGASEAIKKAAIRDADTQLYSEIVQAKQRINPIEALAFLKSVKKSMSAEDASKLEAVLDRAIPEWEGEKAADRVFEGLGQNPHRKYAQAREMLGKEKFSDPRSKEKAEIRLLQRQNQSAAMKRTADGVSMDGLMARASQMTVAELKNEIMASDFEPDIAAAALKSVDAMASANAEERSKELYYNLRDDAFTNREQFLKVEISSLKPILGNEKTDQLKRLQEDLRNGILSEIESAERDAMRLWEAVNKAPTSASDLIEYRGKRNKARERVLGALQLLQSTGELKNSSKVDAAITSVLYETRERIKSWQRYYPGREPEGEIIIPGVPFPLDVPRVAPDLYPRPVETVKEDASVRAMMTASGFNIDQWAYEEKKGVFMSSDAKEIRAALIVNGEELPGGFEVKDIEKIEIDLFGRVMSIMARDGSVYRRTNR